MKILIAILVVSFLTGCTIGNGRICAPQTPAAYCDKEAYEKLAHPQPYGAHWVKEGMTREKRLEEFIECNGSSSLKQGYEIQYGQSNDAFFAGFNAHVTKVAACMRSKGYSYLENCSEQCMYP